jgi:glycosyltransferase involved in cell wall biosynthesis
MIDNKILTVVIPCKNEGINVIQTLKSIFHQKNINNLDVIIADSSDDKFTFRLITDYISYFSSKLNIKIIEGGFPAEARANGAKLVKSKYILFVDGDVELIEDDILDTLINKMDINKYNLSTIKFITDEGYNYIYKWFNFFQKIGIYLNSCFAVGGFQLWNTEYYNKIGGYQKELLFAEDYWLSSKVNKKEFYVDYKNGIYTSARRFKSKGIYYMIKMMLLSYLNRNNIEFFKKHHNYWK